MVSGSICAGYFGRLSVFPGSKTENVSESGCFRFRVERGEVTLAVLGLLTHS